MGMYAHLIRLVKSRHQDNPDINYHDPRKPDAAENNFISGQ